MIFEAATNPGVPPAPIASVPPLIVVAPVYELALVRFMVPASTTTARCRIVSAAPAR